MVEQVFGTVQHDRLCEQVARQVQEMILAGHLPEGSQLPSERELAERFGVSRTVIREAMKVLGERGLIEVMAGRGSFVTRLSTEAVSLYMGLLVKAREASPGLFHEVRTALEVAAAGHAATRITPEELAALRVVIEMIDDCLRRGSEEDYIAADLKLHALLAEASHNSLFRALLEPLRGAIADLRHLTYAVSDSPRRGQVFHRLLLQAIERGDAVAAREVMQQHMAQVARDIEEAQVAPPP